MGLVSLQKKPRRASLSLQPYENTARRQPSGNQEAESAGHLDLGFPCEKYISLFVGYPVCGSLL